MGRNSPRTDSASAAATAAATTTNCNNDRQHSRSVRDRRFKRNPNHGQVKTQATPSLHRHVNSVSVAGSRFNRKSLFPFRGAYLLYFMIFLAVFAFAMASMVLQNSIASVFGAERGRPAREWLRFGSRLKFVSGRVGSGNGLDGVRFKPRFGVRPPRVGLILGNMAKDPQLLMLITVVKNLQRLGYVVKIYAVENGKAHSMWEQIGVQISILGRKEYGLTDWSIFDGIIADSLEAKEAISSLMQEPFHSIPLIWIIQEDGLANRLPAYVEKSSENLLSNWKSAFSRANVVVFPDYTLPMLYSVLDTGNFVVIPGSPVDVWAAETYSKTHAKYQLRKENGFLKDDIVVLVVGSSFFYSELSWDYAVAMLDIGPLLIKYARRNNVEGSFKFVFLCGNSTDGYNDALQEVALRLGLLEGSVRHYGFDGDVNGVLLMADIVLYSSSQVEQGFPSLIIRAMTFGIPVITPDFPIIKKYVVEGTQVIFYPKDNPEGLARAFTLFISNGKLSKLARTVASAGRLHVKNMLVLDCVTGYARLLENVLNFPSDALLPGPISQLQQVSWEWNLFRKEIDLGTSDISNMDEWGTSSGNSSAVDVLEEEFTKDVTENGNQSADQDTISELDWEVLRDIETSEEYERLEVEQLEERMEGTVGVWDDIYRNTRKSERLKFEANERDEGELERTGQPVCIYEIYSGSGAWPFLHHGSLYRGLSLSSTAQRLRSDDVDAVSRLRLLNYTHYRDILCEIGGMFAVAKKVDNIHKRPWIGFQSWRASGRKVSLSITAEMVLEETIQETKGDAMYFWAYLDNDGGFTGSNNDVLPFWSMCDILNGGHCSCIVFKQQLDKAINCYVYAFDGFCPCHYHCPVMTEDAVAVKSITAFEDAFRQMYGLPSHVEVLPPMPADGHWSALHSWVMPTPSFLEFIMFSRMFIDSLDALNTNSSKVDTCLLSSTELEKKHCYCRMLELLVNVWAYHSGRKMVYLDPVSGAVQEQHPIEGRRGFMWMKYFNFTLLKSMDEDLAEAADDGDYPREKWLWPLTGEVHWQGIYEREREERYRQKLDKKRKTKEKLIERMTKGYKQKTLGG